MNYWQDMDLKVNLTKIYESRVNTSLWKNSGQQHAIETIPECPTDTYYWADRFKYKLQYLHDHWGQKRYSNPQALSS